MRYPVQTENNSGFVKICDEYVQIQLWQALIRDQIGQIPQENHIFCTFWSPSWGGFRLLDLIIMELKSHMTFYTSMPLIG